MLQDKEYLKIKSFNEIELELYIQEKINGIQDLFDTHFSSKIKSYPNRLLLRRIEFLQNC